MSPGPYAHAVRIDTNSFFVNEVGHIRMTEAPEKPYIYHATNNERVNDVRREAMQGKWKQEESGIALTVTSLPARGIREAHTCFGHRTSLSPWAYSDEAQRSARPHTLDSLGRLEDTKAHCCRCQ